MAVTSWIPRLALCGAIVSGCAHVDVDDPAPGIVDISTPPPVVEQRHVVPPASAGEKMLVVNGGGFGSIGFQVGDAGLGTWSTLGGELSVHWGHRDGHHADDTAAPPVPTIVFPKRAWGLTFGVSRQSAARQSGPSSDGSDLYLEIQRTSDFWMGVAAGPVWNPTSHRLGAQLTAFLGVNYVRVTMLDLNPVIQIGLMLKPPVSWVWSK